MNTQPKKGFPFPAGIGPHQIFAQQQQQKRSLNMQMRMEMLNRPEILAQSKLAPYDRNNDDCPNINCFYLFFYCFFTQE